jgi:type IV pilus assembly protein PilW
MLESRHSRTRLRGVSLIELMVAMTISLALIGGAIQVYVYSRKHYEDNEGLARLQETARYALSVMESDIRMSNSWGLAAGLITISPPGFNTQCGTKFVANESAPALAGNDNKYSFATGCPLTTTGAGASAIASADTLIVRRASALPSTTAATTSRLRVCSTRTGAQLVATTSSCESAPIGQVNDLIENIYYISRDADQRTNLPTLRRWGLTGNVSAGGTPATFEMAPVEIIPGVEDMQIQFGIDPTGVKGTAARYVNPEDATAGQIVSVRLWLLVRAETAEPDFKDEKTYEYGDRAKTNGTTNNLNASGSGRLAYKPNDNFRRLLVTRTYQIRNSIGI